RELLGGRDLLAIFSRQLGHAIGDPSELGVDALLDRAELLRHARLTLLEDEQAFALAPELLPGDLLLEDEIPVLLRHRPEELEPIGEVRERTRGEQEEDRARRRAGERTHSRP